MSLKKFIFSKLFLKHLGLMAAITAGIIMILLIWMNLYTMHGQSRPVPDFYGLTAGQAESLANSGQERISQRFFVPSSRSE